MRKVLGVALDEFQQTLVALLLVLVVLHGHLQRVVQGLHSLHTHSIAVPITRLGENIADTHRFNMGRTMVQSATLITFSKLLLPVH